MNLPNKLSTFRIILIPFMLIFMIPISGASSWNNFLNKYGMIFAVIIFIIASLTDYFDGNIARKRNLVTTLGKFLDPIADKLLVISAFIAFAALGRLTAWVPIIVLFREFIVTGVRTIAASKGVIVSSKMFGKIKATLQMIVIIALMIEHILIVNIGLNSFTNTLTILINITLVITVIITLLSGLTYITDNKSVLTE